MEVSCFMSISTLSSHSEEMKNWISVSLLRLLIIRPVPLSIWFSGTGGDAAAAPLFLYDELTKEDAGNELTPIAFWQLIEKLKENINSLSASTFSSPPTIETKTAHISIRKGKTSACKQAFNSTGTACKALLAQLWGCPAIDHSFCAGSWRPLGFR